MLLARPRLRVLSGGAAVLLVVVSLLAAGVAHEAADRLVHPPRELDARTPADRGLGYERVAFPTTDRIELVGWWIPADKAIGTVVFLHGYSASKAQALSVAPFLHRHGFNVFAFDFRAHGESGGDHTSVGVDEADDVRAAVAYLRARGDIDMERVALFGWSMGAAAALNAADELPEVRAFVADSSFARIGNVVSNNLASFTGLPRYPFEPLVLYFASQMAGHRPAENEPARHARSLHRPLLVIQGEDDGLARPDGDGRTLAEAAGDWAELWLVPGAGHVDARRVEPGEYESRVVGFLQGALA